MKVKVDIVIGDDIKIYYTGKFQDFTARYIIKLTKLMERLLEQALVICKALYANNIKFSRLCLMFKACLQTVGPNGLLCGKREIERPGFGFISNF